MKFFKPEDLLKIGIHCCEACINDIVNFANAKLNREGRVVYQHNKGPWSQTPVETFTHDKLIDSKALLINIEPVETCTHSKEKVGDTYQNGMPEFQYECGAKVIPKEFEEIS